MEDLKSEVIQAIQEIKQIRLNDNQNQLSEEHQTVLFIASLLEEESK